MASDVKPVVLVVDDTPDNIALLDAALRDDYRIKAATHGSKALEIAGRSRPDIILLDIMMPELSGYDVCRSLKSDPGTADIPVIFITAKTDVEDEQHGFRLGAVDYITKPFDPDIVRARVSTQISIAENARRLQQENEALREQAAASRKLTDAEIKNIVRTGETSEVEFKSTLRWNLHADKTDSRIENECLKAVAAFLNGNGGLLLVGIDDDGKPVGIAKDRLRSEDKYLLHWHNLVREYLGADLADLVNSTIRDFEHERVMLVQCRPSPRPIFFRRDNHEGFYLRMGNTSQELKPSEMLAYVDQHFGDAR